MHVLRLLLTMSVPLTTSLVAQASEPTAFWRSTEAARVNELYLLLKYSNDAVRYEDVRAAVEEFPGSMNLADMWGVAARFCPRARMVQLDVEDLATLRSPVLAHLDSWHGDIEVAGGFLLVYGIEPERGDTLVIGSVTGTPSRIAIDDFAKMFTGTGLLVDGEEGSWVRRLAVTTMLAGLVVLFLSGRRAPRGLEIA